LVFARLTRKNQEADMATIQPYCAKDVYDPPGYSQAMKVTGAQTILFLSGQVAYDEKGGPAHPGDFTSQARAVFRAVKAQVEAGGGSLANVVKLTTYLTDIRHRADLVPVREEFFGKKLPASTLVGVAALAHPAWLIEVEAIAVV
jgi:enamine deaminase RidA (YjgF/YER057c/UK114 family)